jgi:type VI secretion system protein ImpI/type VI secretion system protein
MRITLSTLRCPDNVVPETRSAGGGEFSIGRAPDNNWVLADPDRVLSKRHCVLAYRAGLWQIADTSTNGTYLNRESEPIGQGQVRDLQDGDRIRLGAYEIEVRLQDAMEEAPLRQQPLMPGGANPFDEDPFAPPREPAGFAPGPAPQVSPWGDDDPLLPADFGQAMPPPPDPFRGASLADHSPALDDAYRPPSIAPAPPAANILPDDWDLDEPLLPGGPAAPPPHRPAAEARPAPGPVPPPPASEPNQPWALRPTAPPPEPFAAPPAAAPAPAVFAAPPAPPPAAPPPAAAMAAAPPQAAAPADGALLAAFLAGAGVPGARIEDPVATMGALGAAFRAMVSGLRAVLIARAAIKGEFRIEQTMIRARGNNPLKFSADDDDALSALLGTGRRTGMDPAEAVAEALRDMKLHELASVAAMQTAVREMLAQLSPETIQAQAGSGGLLPMQRKARAFEVYEASHAALVRALADDFDSAFGKAFARAYEEALREAAAKPEES